MNYLLIALIPVGFILGYLIAAFRYKNQLGQDFLKVSEDKHQWQSEAKSWQSKYETLQENLIASQQQQKELSEKMNKEFQLIAHHLLEEKSSKFTELNLKNISQVLDPLKERLKDFEKKVEDAYAQERGERGLLRGELNKLMELNHSMSRETESLTRALKGDTKTQGNWGELILENILERSGLRKDEEYVAQGTDLALRGEEGQRLQPDIIVNLPGGKHLIVDSKMSLKAYEAYCSSSHEEEKERWAKAHIKSLEDHIQGLSGKEYHLADKLSSPDFVILFMPLEPAFALAFKLKPDIFQNAWDKNIAIVSPTTLLTTLRTAAALWKQERQQKNALEIARRGGLLYEKFVGLLNDLNYLGGKLKEAQTAHTDVIKKLSEGRGNLLGQVEELKSLGAKSEKNLPSLDAPLI